jgi:hypothetical protein
MVLFIEETRHPLSQENLMLTIPLDKLGYIMTKAREFDVEVPPVDEQSDSNPSDDPEGTIVR